MSVARVNTHMFAIALFLLAQPVLALTVTLDSDDREVYAGTFWTVGPDTPGAYFDFAVPGAYQTSYAPQRLDSNTYQITGQGSGTYDYDCYNGCDGSFIGSRYSITFTVDTDAQFDIALDMLATDIPVRTYGVAVREVGGDFLLNTDVPYGAYYSGTVSESVNLVAGTSYIFYTRQAPFLDDRGYVQQGEIAWDLNATITAVPIPAAAWLFGSALAGLGWFRRK